jgi:hypothetical protein
MRLLSCLGIVSALALGLSPSSRAQCDGDPGYNLTIPSTLEIGGTPTISVDTAVGGGTAVFVAPLSGGPTPSQYGELCVGLPFLTLFPLPIPADGHLSFPCSRRRTDRLPESRGISTWPLHPEPLLLPLWSRSRKTSPPTSRDLDPCGSADSG